MQDDYVRLMQRLAPDLAQQIEKRALVLERIAALQPVGRRLLAARLNLPEREVRSVAALLKEHGMISMDGSGMVLTAEAEKVLSSARRFSRENRGLTEMEREISSRLGIEKTFIIAGDFDQEMHVLQEVAKVAATQLRALLQSGFTLAVTGGQTIHEVAVSIAHGSAMNVMVVPARGAMGSFLETQANAVASEIARRLGGHHRLIHLPDDLDEQALAEMKKLREVAEALELLQRADVVMHGIGRADEMVQRRRLPVAIKEEVLQKGAVAEAYGCYFDLEGRVVFAASSVAHDIGILKPSCSWVAVAAGSGKAQAITGVMKSRPHAVLVTDEGAAREVLKLIS